VVVSWNSELYAEKIWKFIKILFFSQKYFFSHSKLPPLFGKYCQIRKLFQASSEKISALSLPLLVQFLNFIWKKFPNYILFLKEIPFASLTNAIDVKIESSNGLFDWLKRNLLKRNEIDAKRNWPKRNAFRHSAQYKLDYHWCAFSSQQSMNQSVLHC
jgi:hypothetical protein